MLREPRKTETGLSLRTPLLPEPPGRGADKAGSLSAVGGAGPPGTAQSPCGRRKKGKREPLRPAAPCSYSG